MEQPGATREKQIKQEKDLKMPNCVSFKANLAGFEGVHYVTKYQQKNYNFAFRVIVFMVCI